MAVPSVSAVSPASGLTGGGTPVTITGTNFIAGATVAFGAVAATSVVVVSGTSITCVSPAHDAGAIDVTVTTSGGTSATGAPDTFTYLPSVTGVNPNTGSISGAGAVTLTGTGFTGTPSVTFGVTAATSVVAVSDTSITCVSPAHAAGVVDITVTNNAAASANTSADKFTYLAAPAKLTQYAGIDYSQRNSVLNAVATMVNNWIPYWSSLTPKCRVQSTTAGSNFDHVMMPLNSIINCVNAMNTEFSLAQTAIPVIVSLDFNSFQAKVNLIISTMTAMQAAKP